MYIPPDPRELAVTILNRSTCHVQVGAVIEDNHGVFSWGWNHSGKDGDGCHAEHHAIMRANKQRLDGATIYVAAQWRKHRKMVISQPCEQCTSYITACGIDYVWYRSYNGDWIGEKVFHE